MNYPELIWRLIELLMQKDKIHEIDEIKEDNKLDVKNQNEAM